MHRSNHIVYLVKIFLFAILGSEFLLVLLGGGEVGGQGPRQHPELLMETGGYRGTGAVTADPVPPRLPGPTRTYYFGAAGDGLSFFFLTAVASPGE